MDKQNGDILLKGARRISVTIILNISFLGLPIAALAQTVCKLEDGTAFFDYELEKDLADIINSNVKPKVKNRFDKIPQNCIAELQGNPKPFCKKHYNRQHDDYLIAQAENDLFNDNISITLPKSYDAIPSECKQILESTFGPTPTATPAPAPPNNCAFLIGKYNQCRAGQTRDVQKGVAMRFCQRPNQCYGTYY